MTIRHRMDFLLEGFKPKQETLKEPSGSKAELYKKAEAAGKERAKDTSYMKYGKNQLVRTRALTADEKNRRGPRPGEPDRAPQITRGKASPEYLTKRSRF